MAALLCAALFVFPTPQAMARAADSRIRAALSLETLQPKPGSRLRIAIRMTPEPGWHGYWQNPGDSGLPVTVRWEAPAGTRFSELRHPAPRLLSVQGIASYVHEGPFALVAFMRVPAGLAPGTRLPLIAHVSWLACSDRLCVPERATLTSELSIGDGTPDLQGRNVVNQAAARLPKALQTATLATTDAKEWLFTIPDQGRLRSEAANIYPDKPGWFAPDAAQRGQRVSGKLLVRVPKLKEGPDGHFSGVVSDGRTSFRIVARLARLSAADPRQSIASNSTLGHGEGLSSGGSSGNLTLQQSDAGKVPFKAQAGSAAAAVGPSASLLATLVLAAVVGGLLLNLMRYVFPIFRWLRRMPRLGSWMNGRSRPGQRG